MYIVVIADVTIGDRVTSMVFHLFQLFKHLVVFISCHHRFYVSTHGSLSRVIVDAFYIRILV